MLTTVTDEHYVQDYTGGFYDLEQILAANTFDPEGEVGGDQIVPVEDSAE